MNTNHTASPMQSKRTGKLDIPALLLAAFFDPASLRIGVCGMPDRSRYALVRKRRDGTISVLGWGDKIPLMLRCIMPVIVHADTGSLPLFMHSECIDDNNPDVWIDRNEKRIIPAGFTADTITTEYEVEGRNVVAVSAVTEALGTQLSALEKSIRVTRLLGALQGLANILQLPGEPIIIIWALERQGSILGRSDHGRIVDICHFWAGTDDVAADPGIVGRDFAPLFRSLGSDAGEISVVCWSPDSTPEKLSTLQAPGCKFITPPAVSGVPLPFLGAYGNAQTNPGYINLLPFHKRQHAEAELRKWYATMFGMRLMAALLLLTLAVAGSYIGISRFLIFRDRTAIEQVNEQFLRLQTLTLARDSLAGELQKHVSFAAGESAVTRLLSDLQEVFPEGVRAEELTIVERDAAGWRISLRAFALSAGLVQPLIGNLEKVRGIRDVRMVYSEQAEENNRRKGLRVKIEAEWK